MKGWGSKNASDALLRSLSAKEEGIVITRIYLVRHAEAEGNLYRRIHGWYDARITENGYRQIAALEQRFSSIHVDAAYSSDLFRTRATAAAVCRPKGLRLHTDRDLREVHMGIWEDLAWGEVVRVDREELLKFNSMDPAWHVDGAETLEALRQRVSGAIRRIAADHPNQTVAVFSHGTAIRNALGVFHGMTIEESARLGHSDNTAVSLLEFEGDRVRILFEDDNSHLPEEISTLARQSWWKEGGTQKMDQTNLWFRPMDVCGKEAGRYEAARKEAWANLYGTMEGFDGEGFLKLVQRSAAKHPESVLCAMLQDRPVGIIEMDWERDLEQGIGSIPFYYLDPETRCHGYGVQLLGAAVSAYRALGRESLRLRCARDNAPAQRFYRRYGFQAVGQEPGVRGPLDVLEKYIGYKDLDT